ncbi:MAG: Rieske (2Fe-2S) domain protein [Verrucomicrobiaceae bacterium]|nr:Rieske (2Fe-2S) domain protein [Verrucomicrobiaceae bacterium]
MSLISDAPALAACGAPSFAPRTKVRSAQPSWGVDQILAEIQRIAQIPLAEATTLPAQAYTSQEFFDWEVDNLFRNDWLPLAHASQIPAAGDFLNIDMLGEPLIVVRGKENRVRVLSRICPHRAMDIMPEGFGYGGHGLGDAKQGEPGCGHTRLFMCPYHAWTFELDGRLKGSPEMQHSTGFQRDSWGLKEFKCEVWNGLVFVNLDGTAEPLRERLEGLSEVLAPWNIGEMKMAIQMEWDCPFNWKVLMENFMESYHHIGAHAKTLQPMMPARDTWNEEERPGYIRAHLPVKPSKRDEMQAAEGCGEFVHGLPPITSLPADARYEWNLFCVYPLVLVSANPDRVIFYRMQPLGPDRLRLLTTTLVPASTTQHPDWPAMLECETGRLRDFHLEDMEVCTAVQRGFYGAGYQRGRLSYLEMSVWLIQRYLAARARDTWPAMDTPAAPSQRPSLS